MDKFMAKFFTRMQYFSHLIGQNIITWPQSNWGWGLEMQSSSKPRKMNKTDAHLGDFIKETTSRVFTLLMVCQVASVLSDSLWTRNCNLLGFSVHGILQARTLRWVAMASSRDLPDPGIKPTSPVSPALADGFFTASATWEAHGKREQNVKPDKISNTSEWFCALSGMTDDQWLSFTSLIYKLLL